MKKKQHTACYFDSVVSAGCNKSTSCSWKVLPEGNFSWISQSLEVVDCLSRFRSQPCCKRLLLCLCFIWHESGWAGTTLDILRANARDCSPQSSAGQTEIDPHQKPGNQPCFVFQNLLAFSLIQGPSRY